MLEESFPVLLLFDDEIFTELLLEISGSLKVNLGALPKLRKLLLNTYFLKVDQLFLVDYVGKVGLLVSN